MAYRKPSSPFAVYTACESRRYWMRTLGCAVVMICSLLKPHLYRNPSRPTRKKRRTEAEKALRNAGNSAGIRVQRQARAGESSGHRSKEAESPRSAKHPCGPQGQLAGRKDGAGNGRAKTCCAGSVKEGGEGAPPSSEMECSSAYNIFSKKRCPVWESTPPTFIVPVSAS